MQNDITDLKTTSWTKEAESRNVDCGHQSHIKDLTTLIQDLNDELSQTQEALDNVTKSRDKLIEDLNSRESLVKNLTQEITSLKNKLQSQNIAVETDVHWR